MRQTTVFQSGLDGYHTYRIPALIAAGNGDLLAFCEGRRNSSRDHGDVDLMLKRSTDGGQTWSAQKVVYGEAGDITIGNPCPVLDERTGTLWLLFCRDNDHVLVTYSVDHGATWSSPYDITDTAKRPEWSWYATGPGVGIQLQHGTRAGRLVIPCDHRAPESSEWGSHVIFSDNHGATWQLGGTVKPGANECQVAEAADGTLQLNMRMQGFHLGFRATAFSRDGGSWWSGLTHERQLPCPVCQASLVGQGDYWLFSNPAAAGNRPAERGARRRMTVRQSLDAGGSWPVARVLHDGPAAYSCLCLLPGGDIGCLYECGAETARERLTFARFSREWLEETPGSDAE